ncbi:CRISPR-associated ring nuclease Csm6 [Pseudoalteromonas sp. SS15]|uniref:CRISPR-associated ring nuclease Csm6 n=1 Tax=Pseudoalteromonas sp. SS15 TaxID=3139393 RepID=UPI003BA99745
MDNNNILLAVSGMTPQIITETLYGIYQQDKDAVPTRIEVITTQSGKQRLIDTLLGPDSPLENLVKDYNLPKIHFNEDDIKVPCNPEGQPLEDVQTEQEQVIVADFITNHVRQLCNAKVKIKNEGVAEEKYQYDQIHASLAGGRKTMSFALGYAMSLFGRPQDKLSHVLVNEPYDRVPDFYYPTPTQVMRTNSGKSAKYDLNKAVVTLANIPLVLMREEMPTQLMSDSASSYSNTVERINKANQLTQETAVVELDFDNLSVHCSGHEVKLSPDCFAFYSWLAQESKEFHSEGVEAPTVKMTKSELTYTRLKFMIKAVLHPTLQVNIEDMSELYENTKERLEMINRFCPEDENTSCESLLFLSKSNNIAFLRGDLDEVELFKKHKNLWTRLLNETNTAFEKALGKRLSSYFIIDTVSKIKVENTKNYTAYKGLNILSKNIHIKAPAKVKHQTLEFSKVSPLMGPKAVLLSES